MKTDESPKTVAKPPRRKKIRITNQDLRIMAELDYKLGIRNMARSPLILIKSTGEVSFANSPTEKDTIRESYNEKDGDMLVFPWAGEWKTDVFHLTHTDLVKHY